MAIATERVARKYLDVVASVAIPVDFPVFEVEDVKVYYGRESNLAVYNVDYTLALDPPNFNTFTVTPLASLIAKIDALIVADPTETNFIVVRRVMDFLTVTNEGAVRDLPFLSRELDRTAMRFSQQGEQLQRAIKLSPKNVDQDPRIEELVENTTLLYKNGKIVAGPTGQDVANAQANAAIALAKAAEAAASALAADADATQTAADRVQTGLDRTQTAADRAQTTLDKAATAAGRAQTTLDKAATAADRAQTTLDKAATAADRVQTGADRTRTGLDAAATAADRVQTGLNRTATEAAAATMVKATRAQAEGATDDTAYMTPLKAKQSIDANAPLTMAALSEGGVGTYVFAKRSTATDVAFGGTVAGSDLLPVSAPTTFSGIWNTNNSGGSLAGTALSGTWRCMGRYDHTWNVSVSMNGATLWMRIS